MTSPAFTMQRIIRIMEEGERRRRRKRVFVEIIALIENHRRENCLPRLSYIDLFESVHELMKSRDGWEVLKSNRALQQRQPLDLPVLHYPKTEPSPAPSRPKEASAKVETPEIIRRIDRFLEVCPVALSSDQRSIVAEFIYSMVQENDQSNDSNAQNNTGNVAAARVEEASTSGAVATPPRPRVFEPQERMRHSLQYRIAQARLRYFGRVRNEVDDRVEPNVEVQEITKLSAAPARRKSRNRNEIKEKDRSNNIESEKMKQKNKSNVDSKQKNQENKANIESERNKQENKPDIEIIEENKPDVKIIKENKPDIEIIKEIKQRDKPDIEIIKEIPNAVSLNHTL